MSQKIQIKRGTDSARTSVTFDQGEPVYTTDTKCLYIGDGATAGGIKLSGSGSFNDDTIVRITGVQTIDGNKRFRNISCGYLSYSGNGNLKLDFASCKFFDAESVESLSWTGRTLFYNDAGVPNANRIVLDWQNTLLSGRRTATFIAGDGWQVATSFPPTSMTSAGTKGQLAISGSFLYVATGTNMWGKVQILPF